MARWKWEGRKLRGYFAARFRVFRPQGESLIVCTIKCDQVVEIYQATADRWEARTFPFGARKPKNFRPVKEVRSSSVEQAFDLVEKLYGDCQGWSLYDEAGLLVNPDEPTEDDQAREFNTRKEA